MSYPCSSQPTIDSELLGQILEKYPGYQTYFSTTLPTLQNLLDKVMAVKEYLVRHDFVPSSKIADDIEENEYYDVKYENILEDRIFDENWSSFSTDLLTNARDVLNVWGLAMHTVRGKLCIMK
jgi:hypothetical protein